MQHMDDALSSWQNERLESRVVWCFLRSGWADGETKDHFVQLTIFRCGHSRDDHAALFHGAFEPPVTCKVLQQGRRQMCKLPQIDQRHFQSNKENIFLQPVSGGKRVSFQDLERKHKEVDWDECARMATLESKSASKARKKMCRSTATEASNHVVLVQGSMDSNSEQQPGLSDIDTLFAAILSNMEAGQWDSAKEGVLQLHRSLKVTSGRESRERGGWKYASDFVLDTVLFGDVVRSLQSDTDVMSKAVKLAMKLVLDQKLSDHLMRQEVGLPQRTTIYTFRIKADYCS
eukprot:s1995_g1.t1